ncbi:hypothetical protein QLQ09_01230 [Brucella sp. NM4]|nr:hypothetical protein [Brucella sp. NM4]WHS30238.1 hypothetical protein QLQ09_01230 [Brucella sp. NM4]WHT44279.1 hypothetical protein QLQ11_20825 [Ochrobactrum sp. SSR]
MIASIVVDLPWPVPLAALSIPEVLIGSERMEVYTPPDPSTFMLVAFMR